MLNNSSLILSLLITSLLLSSLIYFEYKTTQELEEQKTPFNKINLPHSLEVFLMNFFYHHVRRKIQYKRKTLKNYLNDYVHKPDFSFDAFYLPKRKYYCQANFLYTMLNFKQQFIDSKFIFNDYTNKNPLKKELSVYFDFLNTSVYKYDEFPKKTILKLQNMEWNPKIKIFFTATNLNYNNYIGQSHLCLFQMNNHIPGTAILHRQDLLVDNLKKFSSLKINRPCFRTSKFYPQTMRLYVEKECKSFFELIKTKKFKKDMKTKILFVFQNVESYREETLDFIELQKLKKIYKEGSLCGRLKNKYIIQEYIRNPIKYKNGRKFVIRVFFIIISTDPLVVLFEKGFVVLQRYSQKSSFAKAIISHEKLRKFLEKNNTINAYQYEMVMNKIKKILGFLNYLSLDHYLKDPRFFQTIAMDFVIDTELEPKLVSVKGSPAFVKKNLKFVKNILELQNKILTERSIRVIDFFNSLKQEVNTYLNEPNFHLESIEEFVTFLENKFNFNKIRKEFNNVFKNIIPSLKKEPYSEFDVIYDETLQEKAYKGLVRSYCVNYAQK
jgi:hypothetical protein